MPCRLVSLVEQWCDVRAIRDDLRPDPSQLAARFPSVAGACRPGVSHLALLAWERRHGHALPEGLKAWLLHSDGLFAGAPLVHPLSAIGPMVPFASVPGLLVQPESWFELGNPNVETVCLDLGYGGSPVFTSGDEGQGTRPRLIANDFDSWFLGLLGAGGGEYWFDPGFVDLGDPWEAHRANVPVPSLADRLRPFAPGVLPMVLDGADDRAIAARFGLCRFDVEAILRHLQHAPSDLAAVAGARAV